MGVLELLTGLGLSASAGLNAWIPLLVVGLLHRYTTLLQLPDGWQWLGSGWVLALAGALLVVEFVADKVPAADTVNDVLQTVVRPSSGGVVFGAGASSETVSVPSPEALVSRETWVAVAVGLVVALGMHLAKAGVRVALDTATFGLAAPVLSTTEDGAALGVSLVAVLVPLLVLVCLAGMVLAGWLLVRRARRRRRRRRAVPPSAPTA